MTKTPVDWVGEIEAIDGLNQEARALLSTDPQQALELSQQAFRHAEGLGHVLGKAHSLFNWGEALHRLSQLEEAQDQIAQALKLFSAVRDLGSEATCEIALGKIHRDLGQFEQALGAFERGLTLARSIDDLRIQADALNGLASIYMMAYGDARRAAGLLAEVLGIRRSSGDKQGEVATLNNLGIIHTELSEYPRALEYLFESLSVVEQHFPGSQLEANCLINLGTVYVQLQDFSEAQRFFKKSLEIGGHSGDLVLQVISLTNLGEVYQGLKDYEQAVASFEAALEMAKEARIPQGEMDAMAGLGLAYHNLGQYAKALGAYQESLRIACEIGQQPGSVVALLGMGRAQLCQGNLEAATLWLQEALTLSGEMENRQMSCEAHRELALAYEQLGQTAQALEHLKAYHRIEREIFNEESERKTRDLTVRFELEQIRTQSEVYRLRTETAQLAQQEAERASQAKSEFLSRMSHELRTPLNAILGFAQLLNGPALHPKDQDSVQQILKAGQHLLGLINEVLDISRIEAGRLELTLEPLPVAELLQESLDLLRPLADQRAITLSLETTQFQSSQVRADRQRLKQVLLNLLSNALKYNRQGGQVRIWCESAKDRLRICIEDTGTGIPAEKLRLLFIPFERLGAEHSRIEGTGIGLALSKRLVEGMEGMLGVTSVLGRGSTFWIELPQTQALVSPTTKPQEPTQPNKEPLPPRPASILYIEDGLANIKLMEMVLTKRPQTHLLAALQGGMGLELACQQRPDLILLDLNLPDLHGLEVLTRLRQEPITQSIPVVIISADAIEAQRLRALELGAKAYLTKPFDIKQLLHLIDTLLSQGEPS